jgi:hypothetical protein
VNERIRRELRAHAAAVAAIARDRGDHQSADRWSRLAELWDTDIGAALAHLIRTDWGHQHEGGGDDAA